MNIIKNAAGKWLIEATDNELLWLDVKTNNYGCKQCPWVNDGWCDGIDQITCMSPLGEIGKAAERIRNENRKER